MPPRYLFRASSDVSRGINTASLVEPAPDHEYHSSINDMTYKQARQMLEAHFKWWYETTSEFSSWSCSLLWVLVHAMRKRNYRCERNVLVYIIDTSKLPKSRVHKALDLLSTYDLENEPNLQRYCKGEYLIHGTLKDADSFRSATLDKLVERGLFGLVPELNDPNHWHLLYRWIGALRTQLYNSMVIFSAKEFVEVQRLGDCFDGDFSLPFTTALISLRNRSLLDIPDILSLVDDKKQHDAWLVLTSNGGTSDQGIPEADQFATILQLLSNHLDTRLRRQRHQTQAISVKERPGADILTGMSELTVNQHTTSTHVYGTAFHPPDLRSSSSVEKSEDSYGDEHWTDENTIHQGRSP